jgi:RNA polymerase sigma factor (TIGR02999 family)
LTENITELLVKAREGDPSALNELMPLVYEELRRMARGRVERGRSDATLGPTALVHELFIKLRALVKPQWNDRRHFYRVAELVLKQLAIDAARNRQARSGRGERVSLNDALADERSDPRWVDVCHAAGRLKELDERLYEVFFCRYVLRMTVEQVAVELEIPERTVKRYAHNAKCILQRELHGS